MPHKGENMQKFRREDLDPGTMGSTIVNCNHHANPIATHWHQYCELLYVQDGEVNINVGGKSYLLQKDSILFIYPCELHSILSSRQPQTVLIQYDASHLNRFPSVADHIQRRHTYLQLVSLQQHPQLFRDIQALLQEFVRMEQANASSAADPFCDVRQYILLCQIHLLLMNHERSLPDQQTQQVLGISKNAIQAVQDTCAYINQNFTEQLSLTQLAEQADMSVSHLSRIFEQYTGENFNTYLVKRRLSHAKLLLANKTLKITDIAFQSGFGSLASFNRAFDKYEGISPTKFRELYNNR